MPVAQDNPHVRTPQLVCAELHHAGPRNHAIRREAGAAHLRQYVIAAFGDDKEIRFGEAEIFDEEHAHEL